ncbi:endonuclease/exonuclease/phosphatase family protein [Leptolyngbya sp. FACHB-1515]|uniref:endonuclease/exonuclease/phosphatase family protein n=1 Tax=Leptolyngbya sp. FACHB-1515 TaxID=2933931 RepID=UPI0032981296
MRRPVYCVMPRSKFQNQLAVKLLALLCFGGIVGSTLVAIVSTRYGWPMLLELASHFQLQYFGFSLVLLGLLLLTRQRWLILISLLCISLLAQQILPWYLPHLPTANTALLRVLASNLNVNNFDYSRLLNLVQQEQPDVVVLMEVNDTWGKPLAPLHRQYPYWFGLSEEASAGIAILSRSPLENSQIVRFRRDSTPSIMTQLTIDQHPVSLVAVHPLVPVRPALFHRRNRQFAGMSEQIDRSNSLIVVGDFNATMWSPYLQMLTAKLGLHNSRKGFGILPTWTTPSPVSPFPAWLAPLLAIPIDHCLISQNLRTIDMHTGAPVGSDHLPIVVDLAISNGQ